MEEAKVIELGDGPDKGYLIVGTRQQCVSKVVSLETKKAGHWYQVGYWSRDPRDEKKDILVWKFFYGSATQKALASAIRVSIV